MSELIDSLVRNSKQALFAAIEIHNKPVFPYRYQICSIALINAWELILKGYVVKYKPDVKVILDDGSTKPFEECIACVKSSLGNNFLLQAESVERLYEYRCLYIHFYDDHIDSVLYSLFAKSVQLYCRFLLQHFAIDLCEETNLILLPVGFKPPVSPIDFLSNRSNIQESSKEVQEFLKHVIASTNTLAVNNINEPIMYTYSMSLINENRTKNADIIAAISKGDGNKAIGIQNVLHDVHLTNDPNAKHIKIDEASLYTDIYTESYDKLLKTCRSMFVNFLQNGKFNAIVKELKQNPNFYKVRYLNAIEEKGSSKGYFTGSVYDELTKHYTLCKVGIAEATTARN